MNPTENPDSQDLVEMRSELHDGLETSREIVRQSRMLIALSECEGVSGADDEDRGFAN